MNLLYVLLLFVGAHVATPTAADVRTNLQEDLRALASQVDEASALTGQRHGAVLTGGVEGRPGRPTLTGLPPNARGSSVPGRPPPGSPA
jgi:hypothetical protein